MASRSRKRRRAPGEAAGRTVAGRPAAPQLDPPTELEAAAPPEPETGPVRADPPTPADAMRRGYARSRERDDLIRANLEPLAPGERPRAVTVAAIVAFCFAIANVAAALTGANLSSQQTDPTTLTAVTTAILLIAAIGMWLRQYWAVLGFEVILALQIIVFSLALVRVQKWWLAIAMVIAIGLLTWLFWKLIRAMARLQAPARAGPQPGEPTR